MEGNDDDDLLPFISLQAATRNAIRYLEDLRNDKPKNEGSKSNHSDNAGKEALRGKVAVIVKKKRGGS